MLKLFAVLHDAGKIVCGDVKREGSGRGLDETEGGYRIGHVNALLIASVVDLLWTMNCDWCPRIGM